jgi:hypothetical protein
MPSANRRILALVLVTMGMLVASGIGASNGRGAPPPTLSIVAPANNAVIGNGTPVAVAYTVTNFNLTEPGKGTSPDSGHVDVFVDDAWTRSTADDTIVLSLPSGPHAIRLRLVTDNGSALNPDVTATVSVLVTRGPSGGTPGLSVVSPRDGALLGTDSTVAFRVTNFAVVPPGGPAGVPNEGFIRVHLDGAFYADLTDAAPLHLNLKDGPHNVTFQLVDSAGRPLNPDVTATVHYTVKALVGRVQPFDATPYLALANVALGLGIVAMIYRKLEAE